MSAVDQAIRDRAIRELDRSIALSAGAGSGKTSVLTRRILELLVQGTPAARIAAITFTEKAAGELQARVRDALEQRLADGGCPDGLLDQLPALTLSTTHGFCHSLLTAEGFEAAWAPETEILPDILSAVEVQEAYREWEAGFRRRHAAACLVVYQLVTAWTLRAGAMRLLGYRDLQPVVNIDAFDPSFAHPQLMRLGADLFLTSRACTLQQHDKLLLANRGLLAVLLDASSRPPTEAVVRVLASGEGIRGSLSHGRKADWRGDGKQLFVAAVQRFRNWRAAQLESLHGLVMRDLATNFLPMVDRAKARAAVADYDDLLFRAARLLRGRPQARARLANRFDAVLIDEVQDTDPIQSEVAALLTRDPDATGEWDAHPPRRGRLFAVGDPRQSIYRFRRADEASWRQLQELLTRDGEHLSLSVNFRSVPGIVDWVNRTFCLLPDYQPQRAHRKAADLTPVVRLPIPPKADDSFELEAIARYLLELGATGIVVDPKSKTEQRRPIAWSDVMLLLPSWSMADKLQSTLTRAGIPAVVEGGGTFFTRDEVRLSIAALKCLDEPGDEQSAVFVLRGLFACTWDELGEHRAAGGSWRFTVPDPPAGPIADAFTLLRRLARQRGRRSWVALLDELLDHSRAPVVWATLRDGEAKLANLDKLRALLRRLEATADSATDVLRQLDTLGSEQDLSRVDAREQAVRITSYFKAKGLEAPVVVLCFGHRKSEGVSAAVDRRARQVAVKLGALQPADWETYKANEQGANDDERQRWMYVAATRARDQLVIVDRDKSKLIREHLAGGLAAAVTIDPVDLPAPNWRDETFAGLDGAVDGWLEQAPPAPDEPDPTHEWIDDMRESIRQAKDSSTRWRTVHELAARERVSGGSSPIGVVGGNLVHAVMQALDLSGSLADQQRHAAQLVPALADEFGVGHARAKLCQGIIHRMLEHPALNAARTAPEHWVEVPFTYRDDAKGCVVSGRIDLAFPTDASREHWYIVDWKSDLPPRNSPGWRNYQAQLDHYAKAVLEIVPSCKRHTTVLVGPYPELASVATLIDRVAELQPALASGVEALMDRGLPEPRVGCDVGEAILVAVDLTWDERKIALCVGSSSADIDTLRGQGWLIVVADPAAPNWAETAIEAIAVVFDLPGEDDE